MLWHRSFYRHRSFYQEAKKVFDTVGLIKDNNIIIYMLSLSKMLLFTLLDSRKIKVKGIGSQS